MSASKEKAQKPKKVVLSSNDKKWAEEVAYRQKAMNAYQTSRNKVKQMKEEFETHMERSKAAQEAAKELTHLSAISDEVCISHPEMEQVFFVVVTYLRYFRSGHVRILLLSPKLHQCINPLHHTQLSTGHPPRRASLGRTRRSSGLMIGDQEARRQDTLREAFRW